MTADDGSENVDPVDPVDPVEPITPAAPLAPAQSVESTEPVESVPPAQEPTTDHGISGGDPRIAEAVDRLRGLADRPAEEHVEVYEAVHRVLHEALADVERRDLETGQDPGDSPA